MTKTIFERMPVKNGCHAHPDRMYNIFMQYTQRITQEFWVYDGQKLKDFLSAINQKDQSSILLYGPPGGGKTTLMKIAQRVFTYSKTHKVEICNTHDLLRKVAEFGFAALDDCLNAPVLVLDDLHIESFNVSNYSNKIDPINELVYSRCENGKSTHFTTNVKTQEKFFDLFADRTRERIKSIIMPILWDAPDYRNKKTA